jgi:aspartyl protease family protein
MKLKFKPSLDPRNNNQSNDDGYSHSGQGMGKGMIAISMILFLGMLTMVFDGALDKQVNPNTSVKSQQTQDGRIIVTLKRNRAGHYVTSGTINEQNVVFLIDTGATNVAIPEHKAKRLGLRSGRAIQVSTANGRTTGHQTIIEHLTIGKISLYNIRAIITPNLNEILLGMSALKQLEFTQKGKTLTIRQ